MTIPSVGGTKQLTAKTLNTQQYVINFTSLVAKKLM